MLKAFQPLAGVPRRASTRLSALGRSLTRRVMSPTSDAPERPQWDCIVVGAGTSGLTCASTLAKSGHRVLVLEARDRIGGRIHTVLDDPAGAIDLGASFVHGVDGNPLTDLARETGVKLYESTMQGLTFTENGDQMPPERAARVQAAAYTALFDGARESSNAALSVPTKSVADFLLAPGSPLFEGLESEEERDHAVQLVQSMDGWTGAPLNEVSFRYWGFEREFEGPDKVVADGYVHMLEPLRSQLLEHHGELRLGDAVTALALDEDAGLVRARTAAGAAFTAKSAVCTLPLGVLQHEPATLAFDPPLAPRRRDALKRATFGLLNKVVLSYPHAWWPKDVLDTSFLHVFLPPASADSEPVATEPNAPRVPEGTAAALPRGLATRMLFAQAYAPLNGAPILMVYFGGARGAALERLSDAEARDWVHAALARALLRLPGAPERAPAPAAVHVSRWLADPFARGAYAYVAATSEKDAGADHPSPLHMVTLSRPAWGGRLGFAGEHTEMDHYASVHGALLSGRREAARVKATLEGEWAEVRNDV